MNQPQDRAQQQVLEGMPRRLFSCTPTRLTSWQDCPRRYRMTYLNRPTPQKGPPWAHNSVGVSVHNALAAWFRLPAEQREGPDGDRPALAARLVDEAWVGEGFRDDAQERQWRARSRQMVADYLQTLPPDLPEPAGVERVVAYRSELLAVSGRVDRIDVRPGESPDDPPRAVVVDYKTGRRPLTLDDARSSLALALYALATARTLHQPCVDVELHHLPTGEVISWRHDEAALARHLRRAEAVGVQAQAAEQVWRDNDGALRPAADVELFPPRPGAGCAWCDFARHCPEGRAVASTKKPWDGLADAESLPAPAD